MKRPKLPSQNLDGGKICMNLNSTLVSCKSIGFWKVRPVLSAVTMVFSLCHFVFAHADTVSGTLFSESKYLDESRGEPYDGKFTLSCVSSHDENRSIEVSLKETKIGSSAVLRDASRESAAKWELGCERLGQEAKSTLVDFAQCKHLEPSSSQSQFTLQWGGFSQTFSAVRVVNSEIVEYFACNE
jgi:hypothetical protein